MRRALCIMLLLCGVIAGDSPTQTLAREFALSPEAEAARDRGIAWLQGLKTIQPDRIGLVMYALLKSGVPADDRSVVEARKTVLSKFNGNVYRPVRFFYYEATIDLLGLHALNDESLRPQLDGIARYIIEGQVSGNGGAWYYPEQNPQKANGDTSISQYAILGLWEARQMGIPVPDDVWRKAARWHIETQLPRGGFCYHPGEGHSVLATGHSAAMTAAGCTNLGIISRVAGALPEVKAATEPKRKFGVLEVVRPEEPAPAPAGPAPAPLDHAQIESARLRSVSAVPEEFGVVAANCWIYYYWYTI